jgi:hypothetical protein
LSFIISFYAIGITFLLTCYYPAPDLTAIGSSASLTGITTTLTFGQMQADMRDVAFYFRKKTGIKMSDSGLADVVLGREGLTIGFHFLFLV